MKNLNPYQIKWAILTPRKGMARKKDIQLLKGDALYVNNTIKIVAPTEEMLHEKLDNAKGKLQKEYSVLIITDKQFGISEGFYRQVATKKQLQNMFVIN